MNENSRINISYNRDTSPCAYCDPNDRHPGCHDHCTKFKSWKKNCDENRKRHSEYASKPRLHLEQISDRNDRHFVQISKRM